MSLLAQAMLIALAKTYVPIPNGDYVPSSPGTYTVPLAAGVREISVVLVAGGNGGGYRWGGNGGNLRYKNNIPVNPLIDTVQITIGAAGQPVTASGDAQSGAQLGGVSTLRINGIKIFDTNSPIGVDGVFGGDGGLGGAPYQPWASYESSPYATPASGGGGGGAGGYSGNGGKGGGGGRAGSNIAVSEPTAGSGGAAGGGGCDNKYFVGENSTYQYQYGAPASPGGGVGLNGQGTSGAAGINRANGPTSGYGGSSGSNGNNVNGNNIGSNYGGGGPGGYTRSPYGSGSGSYNNGIPGGPGGVGGGRVIYGEGRSFPLNAKPV